MNRENKCVLDKNNFYNWCIGMDSMLHEEANAHVKGITQVNLFNFQTRKESCLGVLYRKEAKEKGQRLMLNFCPWCGSEIINKSKLSGGGKK